MIYRAKFKAFDAWFQIQCHSLFSSDLFQIFARKNIVKGFFLSELTEIDPMNVFTPDNISQLQEQQKISKPDLQILACVFLALHSNLGRGGTARMFEDYTLKHYIKWARLNINEGITENWSRTVLDRLQKTAQDRK